VLNLVTGYQEGAFRMQEQVRREESDLGRQVRELDKRVYQGLEGDNQDFEQSNIQPEK